ncbi:hypothetical protein EVB32_152 [Rhizobium phage RHph_TM39]|uniref:Uncharacterized protein n=1 Tax=Rhizobium phage RHph_TM30 TaxID=2509764 RepID=A0A7S5UW10_9CAUD|nr:hypothetical protein PQC16_gp152 [Rhizobium phage RHph_TM30]QIG71621.1 hypothetical protein EVB94_150 [Rhizobium phage RHph_TM40]QIG71985.1 hypothetical protein EVB95_151 [Rhizobium phage RHph_TM2_3B]QIG72348.1 hypothetical protein EVB96_152 [Rhizobium phage RHph_TM3_3_6]QIG77140.1 hypothetical protein EVB32_152 [Rhizobium phage RHph_TM39]QIG77474.1 hypothetical protein EVB61_146 [Rhizobium phage RHph_TM21B]QIG77736.1 hypothetical protein EVB64_149 [Rhizobium phage RHph_TM61]
MSDQTEEKLVERSEYYTVEVRTWHLHEVGLQREVDADVWNDCIWHLLFDSPGSVYTQKSEAIDVRNRIVNEAHIPSEDIRVTRVIHEVLDIE